MQIDRSIETLREFYTEENRVSKPTRASKKVIEGIYGELKTLMMDNFDNQDQSLRQLYTKVSSNRLDRFTNNLSYTDSTDLVRAEVECGFEAIPFDYVRKDGIRVTIRQPVKSADVQLSGITQENFYQYVMVNALDWMYGRLKEDSKDLDGGTEEFILTAYNELNSEDLYYNKSAFESRVTTGSIGLRNLISVMNSVIKVFLKEKSKIQLRIERAKSLDAQNAMEEQKMNFIMNSLSPENTVYYRDITLGGNSQTSKGDKWVCGNCGQESITDEPIISADASVFSTSMKRRDIRGRLHFGVTQCDHCGMYNILPGVIMTSLEDILVENNVGSTSDQRASKNRNQVGIGQGLLDQAIDSIQSRAETSESTEIRELYTEELAGITTFQNVRCDLADSLTDFGDIDEDIGDLMGEALRRVDSCFVDYNELADGVTKEEPEVSRFSEVYGSRVETSEDGKIILGPSKIFVQFAGTLLRNWTDYGHTAEDAIATLCSIDMPYYNKLLKYKNMAILKLAVEKLHLYLSSIGMYIGSEIIITTDRLESLYREILELPYNLYDCLGTEYPILREIRSGLNLEPIDMSESAQYMNDAALNNLMSELSELHINSDLEEKCRKKIFKFWEQYTAMQYGALKKMRTAKTLMLEIFCEDAIKRAEDDMKSLEEELITDMVSVSNSSGLPIKPARDEVSVDSTMYFLPREFLTKITNRVYMQMLKNTLCKTGLDDLFSMQFSFTADIFKNYRNTISRVRRVFMRMNVSDAEKDMFCTIANSYNENFGDNFSNGGGMTPVDGKNIEKCKLAPKKDEIELINYGSAAMQEIYTKFAVWSFCDYLNAVSDIEGFELITFMDSYILDSKMSIDEINYDASRLAAIVFSAPEQDKQLKRDVLDYIQKNCSGLSYVYSDTSPGATVWDEEDEDEDDEEYSLDSISSRKRAALDTLSIFYANFLPKSLITQINEDS